VNKKGFIISMDLIISISLVMIMVVMLVEATPYEWNKYSYVSDALTVLTKRGISSSSVDMQAKIEAILPYESFNFTIVDFGPMAPLKICSDDSDCNSTYSSCIFYVCGNHSMNIETGDYQEYSTNPFSYCSINMITAGSCKPEGDTSQRLYVELGDDDLIDNFYIIRMEVAE
jgi:hypothetical protein